MLTRVEDVPADIIETISSIDAYIDALLKDSPLPTRPDVAIVKLSLNYDHILICRHLAQLGKNVNTLAYYQAFRGLFESHSSTQQMADMRVIAQGLIDGGDGSAAERMISHHTLTVNVVADAYRNSNWSSRRLALLDAETIRAAIQLFKQLDADDLTGREAAREKIRTVLLEKYAGTLTSKTPKEYIKYVDLQQTYHHCVHHSQRYTIFFGSHQILRDLKAVDEEFIHILTGPMTPENEFKISL